ncbi:hypothetical protein LXA43DRAFT_891453 [Ganoderma leucocontextum]|nr:hypothetical protein LXA43DRAFT_891453 [Ganoderma leucocontextum]
MRRPTPRCSPKSRLKVRHIGPLLYIRQAIARDLSKRISAACACADVQALGSTQRTLYRARVEPHLTYGCEVALDVRPQSVGLLEKVQLAVFRRLLGLASRSQLIPLFSETGLWPIRYRRLELALRFAQYVLREQPRLALAALHDAYTLASLGCMSWVSDLCHAFRALPCPVQVPCFASPQPTEQMFSDLAAALSASLARWLYDGILLCDRLPILQWRCRPTLFPPSQIPPLRLLCAWHGYLLVPNNSHRQALTRLLASEHPFAIEVLRRAQPPVPRHWRICRYCQRQSAVETEVHVLFDCPDPRLLALRDPFLHDAQSIVGPIIQEPMHRWSSLQLLDFLLTRDKLLVRLAEYVHAVVQLTDSIPVMCVLDDATYHTLLL